MHCSEPEYENTIDVAAIIASVLRGWKWIVASAVLLALLLGGYESLRPADVTVDKTRAADLETSVSADQTSLSALLEEIRSNRTTVLANAQMIQENRDLLEVCHASREALTGSLEVLQSGLDAVQQLADEAGASAAFSQIPSFAAEIAEVHTRQAELSRQIVTAGREITTWQGQIDSMYESSAGLLVSGGELAKKIAGQQWEMAVLNVGVPRPKHLLRKAAVGGMLGAVLGVAGIFLLTVLDRKLRAGEELYDAFRLPVLGEFYSERARRHHKIDQMLDRLQGDIQTLPEAESVYGLVAAGIMAEAREPLRLAVTGTVGGQTLDDLAEKLRTLLPGDFQVTARENPVYNADFLAHIKEYSVLLAEEKGKSDKREIARLMALLGRSGVPVVGAVIK